MMYAAMGLKKWRARNSRGKRAMSVRATEVLLYVLLPAFESVGCKQHIGGTSYKKTILGRGGDKCKKRKEETQK